jgi:hypothetical protein
MGKNYSYSSGDRQRQLRERRQRVHPIWKVIGYSLMVLIPVMAYAGMNVFIDQPWFPKPDDLMAMPGQLFYNIFNDPLIYIKTITFVLLMAVFYVVFLLLSFVVSGAFGMSGRNDPYYVPPVRRTTPPRRR